MKKSQHIHHWSLIMNRAKRILTSIAVVLSMAVGVDAAVAAGKAHQHNGQKQVGNKIKTKGNHVIDKVGKHTVSIDVENGKIAGFKVKHSTKGDVAVKKYKTTKKMAQAGGMNLSGSPYMLTQLESLGTTYIGYAYYDDFGDEQIYWFPYEMILDGDTGAIEYVPII